MCGLVGMAGILTAKHEKAFKDLLTVDAIRGIHSVGVTRVTSAGKDDSVKRAMPVSEFLDLKKTEKLFNSCNRVLIGHNRAATKGAVNTENAHPFEFSDVVGVHNGTLRNQKLLPNHDLFEVDSENLFYAINENGTRDTAKKIHGAFALTWWNKKEKSLHLWRNKERPLWFCHNEEGDAMFWASEPWMLTGVLGRHSIKHTKPEALPTEIEYIINFGPSSHQQGKISDKRRIRSISHDMYTPPPVQNSYQNNAHHYGNGYQSGGSQANRAQAGGGKKPQALPSPKKEAGQASKSGNGSSSPSPTYPKRRRVYLRRVK